MIIISFTERRTMHVFDAAIIQIVLSEQPSTYCVAPFPRLRSLYGYLLFSSSSNSCSRGCGASSAVWPRIRSRCSCHIRDTPSGVPFSSLASHNIYKLGILVYGYPPFLERECDSQAGNSSAHRDALCFCYGEIRPSSLKTISHGSEYCLWISIYHPRA